MPDIVVTVVKPGVAQISVRHQACPQVARHWEEQLTGAKAKHWGRIWIDPDKAAADERRKLALGQVGPIGRGMPQANRDECPGAMFIWETQEVADVELLCAVQNQAFGRDLYRALKSTLGKLDWWEVRFAFR